MLYNILCSKDINMVHKVYATYICCIILYTIWIHLTPWRIYIWTHNNQLVLSIYCLVSTILWLHLESTLVRWAPFSCVRCCGPRGSGAPWLTCMDVWMFVCVYSSVVQSGFPFSLLESICRHFLRFSSDLLPTLDCFQAVNLRVFIKK